MVETSTLTPHQELVNRLGTGHPQKQLLVLLERIEAIEKGTKPATPITEVVIKTRSEKMKEAWARRKALKA